MKTRLILSIATALILGAGSASAVTPNTTEYVQKTQATITGTLVSIDDRLIVLDTDQGQRVTLLMDSRTMLPVNHAPGQSMRIHFKVLENGQYYAERLTPLDDLELRNVSYRDYDESGETVTHNTTYRSSRGDNDEDAEGVEGAEGAGNAGDAGEGEGRDVTSSTTSSNTGTALPQTASNQPLIALLGLAALAGSAALARSRRAGSKSS